jgi:hypothetical protein
MTNIGTFGESAPVIGARIITVEGDELGRVKEVSGDCFKVDAPSRPDYWLGTETIASGSQVELRLGLSKAQIGEAEMDGARP